jgi:hypothetical protein
MKIDGSNGNLPNEPLNEKTPISSENLDKKITPISENINSINSEIAVIVKDFTKEITFLKDEVGKIDKFLEGEKPKILPILSYEYIPQIATSLLPDGTYIYPIKRDDLMNSDISNAKTPTTDINKLFGLASNGVGGSVFKEIITPTSLGMTRTGDNAILDNDNDIFAFQKDKLSGLSKLVKLPPPPKPITILVAEKMNLVVDTITDPVSFTLNNAKILSDYEAYDFDIKFYFISNTFDEHYDTNTLQIFKANSGNGMGGKRTQYFNDSQFWGMNTPFIVIVNSVVGGQGNSHILSVNFLPPDKKPSINPMILDKIELVQRF